MSSVGLGFGTYRPATKINHMPKNPMDKCTIVSVYPEKIVEDKPTIFPGHYEIDAAAEGDFSILVVGTASWFKEMEEGMPLQEIPTSSLAVAESFIRDYTNGLLGYGGNQAPGLFYVLGEYTKKTIIDYVQKDADGNPTGKTFKTMIDEARTRQTRWFRELVRLSDIMWARTNGNPLSVNKDARLAAEKLGLNKTWMQDFKTFEMINCKACGHLVNPTYPVCANCKTIINPAKAKELGITFAA